MLDQTENPFPTLTPLTVSTVSRITSAPVQAIKTWIQYGYITRPTKRGPTFHFAAKNVMEVAIMKTLCFDLGMRAKVAARAAGDGIAGLVLEHCQTKRKAEVFILFDGRGLRQVSMGDDRAWESDWATGKVTLPIGRIWGEVLVRAEEYAEAVRDKAEREGRVEVRRRKPETAANPHA